MFMMAEYSGVGYEKVLEGSTRWHCSGCRLLLIMEGG
jgi:hypothetical protein